jgi:hypothetical protein
MTFKGAELNYPVHEKEMLAIICAPNKWCSNLIGVPILIYTNHKTLENFDSQKDLSHHQARSMSIPYPPETEESRVLLEHVNGSCVCTHVHASCVTPPEITVMATTLSIMANADLVSTIQTNYVNDTWCKRLLNAKFLPHGIYYIGGLLYVGNRMIIPSVFAYMNCCFTWLMMS